MKKIILSVVLVLTLALLMTAPVFAASNTKLNIFQDVSDGGGELRDTVGTGSYGFANTNQNANGDLRVEGALKGVAPNTTYNVIIYVGPTHANAIAILYSGTVTTNPQGNANTGAIIIPAASLSGFWGGSGYQGVGHIDFDNTSTTGTYVATGINYTIP